VGERILHAVAFGRGSIEIQYATFPDDVRRQMVASHSLEIADDADYGDGIDAVRRAVYELLNDALEDLASTPPLDPAELAGDDDDEDDDDDEAEEIGQGDPAPDPERGG
jgi:hypothetical protein